MPSLAITGSLGSGKSTASSMLLALLRKGGATVTEYSADGHNRSLLREDPGVRRDLLDSFGPGVLGPDGIPDREILSRSIRESDRARAELERILHPRLRAVWQPAARACRGAEGFFLAEIPLLLEKGLAGEFDRVVAVACSPGIRKGRLASSRGLDPQVVDRWLSLQAPQDLRAEGCHHLLWNDGPDCCLQRQVEILAHDLLAP
jgi:dephospho-CoA kinase